MIAIKPSSRLGILAAVLAIISCVLCVKLLYNYKQQHVAYFADYQRHGIDEIKAAQETMQQQVRAITALADQFAQELSSSHINHEHVLKRMQEYAAVTANVATIGVAYQPHALHHERRLYAREFVKSHDKAEEISLEKFYDYTGAVWYKNAIDKGAGWSDPYFSVVLNTQIISYCVPITHFDTAKNTAKPIGVVYFNITLVDVARMVEAINMQYAELAFVIDRNGTFIFHPQSSNVTDKKTIFDVSHEPGQSDFSTIGKDMVRGEMGSDTLYDATAHKEYWVYFAPISNTGWSLALMVEKEMMLAATEHLKKGIIKCGVGLLLCLFFLLMFIFGGYSGQSTRLWYISTFMSLAMVLFIGFIWHLEMTQPHPTDASTTIINNGSDLQRFLTLQLKTNTQLQGASVYYIPTNLYVSTIDIPKEGTAIVRGYIWQMYDKKIPASVKRGVRIDNAIRASITPAYQVTVQQQDIMGYKFEAEFETNVQAIRYPFGNQLISIQLSPIEFAGNVIVVPNFESWDVDYVRSTVGLAQNIVVVGWQIVRTFFHYSLTRFDTNFGIEGFTHQKEFPELQFNILLKRNIYDSLVGSLITIIVVLSMLFGILLISNRTGEKALAPESILSMVSSVLFSTIFVHQRIKSILPNIGYISYLEYLCFLCYIVILLVSFNCLTLRLSDGFGLLRANNNLIAKVLFWPLVTFSALIITLIIFY